MTNLDSAAPESKDPIVLSIIRARKEQGYTQDMLAASASLSRGALVAIEGGGDCTLGTLRKLCGVLGLDLSAKPQSANMPTLDDVTEENRAQFFSPSP